MLNQLHSFILGKAMAADITMSKKVRNQITSKKVGYSESSFFISLIKFHFFIGESEFDQRTVDHLRLSYLKALLGNYLWISVLALIFGACMEVFRQAGMLKIASWWFPSVVLTFIGSYIHYRFIKSEIAKPEPALKQIFIRVTLHAAWGGFVFGSPVVSVSPVLDFTLGVCIAITVFALIMGMSFWLANLLLPGIVMFIFLLLPTAFYALQNSGSGTVAFAFLFPFSLFTLIATGLWSAQDFNRYLMMFEIQKQSDEIEALNQEYVLNSRDWVWSVDLRGNITSISLPQGANRETHHWLGKPIWSIFDMETPHLQALKFAILNSREFNQFTLKSTKLTSGAEFGVWELRGKPIVDDEGNVIGIRGFGRDVFETYRFNEMRRTQEIGDTANRFVAKVAHDFNNALMVIQSNVEYLNHNATSNEQSEILNLVSDAIDQASSVNNELLSYSKLELLRPEPLHVASILNHVRDLHKAKQRVNIHVEASDVIVLKLDKTALHRSIENLVKNAIEAMGGAGDIFLSLEACAEDPNMAQITIKDTGEGFTPEALERADEIFFTTKGEKRGSGLGLATVAGFVQQSGGAFSWGNYENGAIVTMRFPIYDEVYNIASMPNRERIDLQEKSILILEDDAEIRPALVRNFKLASMKVFDFGTYDQASEWLRNSGMAVDVLLSDIRLHNDLRTGLDFCNEFKHHTQVAILMTGYTELLEEIDQFEVLPKPFRMRDFDSAYSRALHKLNAKAFDQKKPPPKERYS